MVSLLNLRQSPELIQYRVAGILFCVRIKGTDLLCGQDYTVDGLGMGTDGGMAIPAHGQGWRRLIRSPWEERFLFSSNEQSHCAEDEGKRGTGDQVYVELEVDARAGRKGQNLLVEEIGEGGSMTGGDGGGGGGEAVRVGRYRLTRWDFDLDFDFNAMRCCGRLAITTTSLDGVILSLLGIILPARGGLLLHSSGLVHCGRGYLFLGPSGAGKSTIARLWGDGDGVLNDELCILVPGAGGGVRGEGLNGQEQGDGQGPMNQVSDKSAWKLFATPFVGQSNRIPSPVFDGSELAVLAFISHAHGRKTRSKIITGSKALAALLKRVFCPLRTLEMTEQIMEGAESLIKAVPAVELEVSLEDGIWHSLHKIIGQPWISEEEEIV